MYRLDHMYSDEQKLLKYLMKSESKAEQELLKKIIAIVNERMEK